MKASTSNTGSFHAFVNSQKFSGVLLIALTVLSLGLANSGIAESYHHLLSSKISIQFIGKNIGLSPELFINEVLMAVFFLLVGLEIKREFTEGELSGFQKASLPIGAAAGGMIVPALIYFFFNKGSETASGWGIPMATDIAFAIGVLSLLGNRIPVSLKILLTALAVVDDLGAVAVIALFYSHGLQLTYLLYALLVLGILFSLNRMKVRSLLPYLFLGIFLWFFIYKSGIHSTISGVLLAMTIPIGNTSNSPLKLLEGRLHFPVTFIIMPLFAMANTAIGFGSGSMERLLTSESLGIAGGLILGKPIGITLFSVLMVKTGWSKLPYDITMKHVLATGFLGGIGFTMSIFISLLAFDNPEFVTNAKMMILLSSFFAGTIGYFILKRLKHEQA